MKYENIIILIFPHILFSSCSCKQYRMSLLKLENCINPELPYADPSPFKLILEVFNSSKGYDLMRGNLTVPKDIPAQNMSGTFSYGKETPTGIKWKYTMKNLNCKNFVIKAIMGSFGIPLKGCVLKKGEYVFKAVDMDAIDSAFVAAPVRSYGMFLSKTTISTKTKTLGCWVCHLKVAPLTKYRS